MFCYLLLLIFFVNEFSLNSGYNENRINSGVVTPPDLFQFVVGLHTYPGWSYCTASVISKRHVLTAAHCVNYNLCVPYDFYDVILRDRIFAETRPRVSWVNDVIAFPMANKIYFPKMRPFGEPHRDIAILEYPEGTDFGVEPVAIPSDYVETEMDEAYIAGYGSYWRNATDGSMSGGTHILHHIDILINTECYGSLMICGGNETHGALPGDSGGPTMIFRNNKWYQIGITSVGAAYEYLTRVSAYCNFIEATTNNEVKCESIYPDRKPLPYFAPIYKGPNTPMELFNFVVPLYVSSYTDGCTATIISKRHLLTSANCIYKNEAPWLIIDHIIYRAIRHKVFVDLRSKNVQTEGNLADPVYVLAYFPSRFSLPWTDNIAVIEYPEGTDFGIEPVALAKDYVQRYMEEAILVGYGDYKINDQMHINGVPPNLYHTTSYMVTENNIGGPKGTSGRDLWYDVTPLVADEGGPVLADRTGKFYQFGVSTFYSKEYDYRTRVSKYCMFIEIVTKNEVQCESLFEPILKPEMDYVNATTVQQNSSSTYLVINVHELLFILAFLLLF